MSDCMDPICGMGDHKCSSCRKDDRIAELEEERYALIHQNCKDAHRIKELEARAEKDVDIIKRQTKRIAELEAREPLCRCADEVRCDYLKRIAELERIIADNCDPSDATEDDAKIIQECFYATYPENL